jgi:ribokinase
MVALAQLESPIAEIAFLFTRVRTKGGTTILNPSPYRALPQDLLEKTSILVLNEHEFSALTGCPTTDITAALTSVEFPLPYCVVTLGHAGLVLAERGRAPIQIGGHKVDALDTTGAGDCFAGWFAAELAHGRTVQDAARRGNAAAAISVTRAGTGSSMPTKSEVENFLRR